MNLKGIRLKRGLTQKELADAVGLDQSAIARYESNEREPNLETLRKFSKELHCTLDELIGKEEEDAVCSQRNDGHG